jgi:flagellar biosynthesis/type III secretory pathway protein FliH
MPEIPQDELTDREKSIQARAFGDGWRAGYQQGQEDAAYRQDRVKGGSVEIEEHEGRLINQLKEIAKESRRAAKPIVDKLATLRSVRKRSRHRK